MDLPQSPDVRDSFAKSVYSGCTEGDIEIGDERSTASNGRFHRQGSDIVETTFITPAGRKYSVVRVTTFPSHQQTNQGRTRSGSEVQTNRYFRDHIDRIRRDQRSSSATAAMEGRYLLSSPLLTASAGCGRSGDFGYEIRDVDENSDAARRSSQSSTRSSTKSRRHSRTPKFRPALPWPCRPCGLILGACHVLLGLCVIVFDVATNWITETVFAITAGICFVNSGIIGLIAARKLDRGSITLLVIFSCLSLGLCFVLIIECSAALNHGCGSTSITLNTEKSMTVQDAIKSDHSDPKNDRCVHGAAAEARAGLLMLALLEAVVDVVSIFVGCKSLCGRYTPDLQKPSSPYHALIYGDLAPPQRPKRIVQDVGQERTGGGRMHSRLLLEYLVPSSASSPESNEEA